MLDLALAQLPSDAREDWKLLARSDTAGATHGFAHALRERKVRFSLGYPVQEHVGEAALSLPGRRWKPAVEADGRPREGAWVAELTDSVDLSAWPAGTRLICRKEGPHPGAQLRFTDTAGHRVAAFAAGGALETIEDGVTGVLFEDQSRGRAARRARPLRCPGMRADRDRHAGTSFSVVAFRENLGHVLRQAMTQRDATGEAR